MRDNKNTKAFGAWFKKSIWAFPLILLLALLVLTAFKISGTSVGVYHKALYGNGVADPNLIYGHPHDIRSDEWLSATQLLVSQSKQGYPSFNPALGSGRDVSLQLDLPAVNWSAIFRPHNWSFFVLPLENAFAFRWWFLMTVLIISCYFFTLKVLPGEKLVAILLSLSLGIAPFEIWWYQTDAFLSIAYGFLIIILLMRIIQSQQFKYIKHKGLTDTSHVLLLIFLLTSFGLLFYPPFLIPIAIVVAFFTLGYICDVAFRKRMNLKKLTQRLGLIIASFVIAGLIGLMYINSHSQVLNVLNHTVYPGTRTIPSGGLNPLKVFNGFLMPQLQSDFHGAHFMANQSEDSNFILLLPFLIIPGFFLLYEGWRKNKKIDFVLLSIQVCAVFFLTRVFVHFGDPIYKLLLLQKVPNERLIIGMGFLGILQIIYIFKSIAELKWSVKKLNLYALAYGAICFISLYIIGIYVRHRYPLFINRRIEILFLAGIFTGVIILILKNKRVYAMALLLILSLASTFKAMPLYHGLGFDSKNSVAEHIDKISKAGDTWATVDIPLFQNVGLLANRRSITGTQIYPDLKFWQQLGGADNNFIFNRGAHIEFTDDKTMQTTARLPVRNFIEVKLSCENKFINQNVDYLLSIKPLNDSCVKQVDKVIYPNLTVYLYKMLTK